MSQLVSKEVASPHYEAGIAILLAKHVVLESTQCAGVSFIDKRAVGCSDHQIEMTGKPDQNQQDRKLPEAFAKDVTQFVCGNDKSYQCEAPFVEIINTQLVADAAGDEVTCQDGHAIAHHLQPEVIIAVSFLQHGIYDDEENCGGDLEGSLVHAKAYEEEIDDEEQDVLLIVVLGFFNPI
ncbi:hypothetical protein DSECCO2_604110 [anaerobic digester metagenome]